MASPSLVVPGVLFVGEDERSRIVALTGPEAGWMRPKGLLQWSNEVSVVARAALTEEVKRDTKAVMPEEQIPAARMPLSLQAAQKSPLIAVAAKLVPKIVEKGVRVHTIGVDRITSSFYYLAEGGGEDPMRAEGDLVAALGAMLGERADNAAIERAMDGIVDRLLRALSGDRVNELAIELAASLPRAANDGSGLKDVDLEMFERELSQLIASAEKYKVPAQAIADAITSTTEQRVDVPLYGDGRRVSQASLALDLGTSKVTLPTYERWVLTGPFKEQAPTPKPVEVKPIEVKPAEAKPIEAQPIAIVSAAPEPKPAPEVTPPSPKPAAVSPKPADAAPRVPRPDAKEEAKQDLPKKEPAAVEAKDETEPTKAEPAEARQEEKPAAEAREAGERDEEEEEKRAEDAARKATTQKPKSREPDKKLAKKTPTREVPWIAIILLLVFAVVAWQVWLKQ